MNKIRLVRYGLSLNVNIYVTQDTKGLITKSRLETIKLILEYLLIALAIVQLRN